MVLIPWSFICHQFLQYFILWCPSTLDTALLCSFMAGSDLGRNHQYRLRLDAVASIAHFEHEIRKSEVVCNPIWVCCIQSAWHANGPDHPLLLGISTLGLSWLLPRQDYVNQKKTLKSLFWFEIMITLFYQISREK